MGVDRVHLVLQLAGRVHCLPDTVWAPVAGLDRLAVGSCGASSRRFRSLQAVCSTRHQPGYVDLATAPSHAGNAQGGPRMGATPADTEREINRLRGDMSAAIEEVERRLRGGLRG